MTGVRFAGPSCAVPLVETERVQLGHGSGGKMSAALLRDRFLPHLGNPILHQLGDGAVVTLGGAQIVVSTDTFVVSPLEFPGGNIGAAPVTYMLDGRQYVVIPSGTTLTAFALPAWDEP